MIRFVSRSVIGLCLVIGVWSGPAAAGWDPESQKLAQEAVVAFKEANPRLEVFFARSYGYAVFPKVTKGGLVFGGAHGDGTVYEQGEVIGASSITQFTFGLQAGGQTFREIVFFKDKEALERFKAGNFEFAADVSAVALDSSASNALDFAGGIAVFTLASGGLMFEASVGGQQFSFEPKP
ncbi:MAG: lipid-binding SYLF domain-containing protein [Kiloniellales bacterium]|nr:lipid-binding SYLF domain-containing protein [Kiloniellales bacterium]